MNREQIIIQTGKRVRWLFWGILVLLFLSLIGLPALLGVELYLFKDNALMVGFLSLFDQVTGQGFGQPLSFRAMFFIGVLTLVLCLLYGALIWQIDKLFKQYALGRVFTEICAKCFNTIGLILIAIFVMSGVLETALPYLFPSDQLNGQEIALLNDLNIEPDYGFYSVFVSLDFAYLLAGCFVIAVAKVMQLGVELQEDVDATI